MKRRYSWLAPFLFIVGTVLPLSAAAPAGGDAPRWFKGNLHTHSLWSDGDDYPEMIVAWYKENGYAFLALSDHNVLQEGERWLELKTPVSIGGQVQQRGGGPVLAAYLARFGEAWVEQRREGETRFVRLKPLAEFRPLFEEPGRFLLIPSEEITANWKRPASDGGPDLTGPVHINVTNPRDFVAPITGEDALTIMQRTVDAVLAQRERTGQPMIPHVNHPNFRWGLTAEEMMQVRGERFFEVYNGHPGVNNDGDEAHASMDRMWDIMLTHRLAVLGLEPMYGIAVDDSHHYHQIGLGRSNAGRGWIMVRARHLTPESVIRAMEAGDFYASSGVTLANLVREPGRLSVEIAAEPGVRYVTQFIGTRRGFDPTSEVIPQPPHARTLPHRRYSADVGRVLAEVEGAHASYTLRGDEWYVRAKIVSSKPKENGSVAGEFETAWVQPVVGLPR